MKDVTSKSKKSDFWYHLPPALIANQPKSERTNSRFLVLNRERISHRRFSDLPELLNHGDLLIVNDTKVIKARLQGIKNTGGKVDILIEKIETNHIAVCHVKASRGLSRHHTVTIGKVKVQMLERVKDLYRLEFEIPLSAVLEQFGSVPLPTYIERNPTLADSHRYQTVYAQHEGAVAAPTAGLHFDNELLDKIRRKGVEIHPITLHIGAGTFQTIRVEDLSEHELHCEWYKIPLSTRKAINQRTGRCIAVGTTVVRTLEHAAITGVDEGETSLFIRPGFKFQVVDSLITNFHLPESSLIMLVSAFCGYELTMQVYDVAVKNRYRFFSYGDSMWCDRAV